MSSSTMTYDKCNRKKVLCAEITSNSFLETVFFFYPSIM